MEKTFVGDVVKVYRQGDLALVKIGELPEGLEEAKTDTLLADGSGGNPHKFSGGKFYLKEENEFVIGYFSAGKNCKVKHIEHGDKDEGTIRSGKLPEANYQIRRQNEDTIQGLKKVQD